MPAQRGVGFHCTEVSHSGLNCYVPAGGMPGPPSHLHPVSMPTLPLAAACAAFMCAGGARQLVPARLHAAQAAEGGGLLLCIGPLRCAACMCQKIALVLACANRAALLLCPTPSHSRCVCAPCCQAENELLRVHQMQLLEKEHSGCAALLRDDKARAHCVFLLGRSSFIVAWGQRCWEAFFHRMMRLQCLLCVAPVMVAAAAPLMPRCTMTTAPAAEERLGAHVPHVQPPAQGAGAHG